MSTPSSPELAKSLAILSAGQNDTGGGKNHVRYAAHSGATAPLPASLGRRSIRAVAGGGRWIMWLSGYAVTAVGAVVLAWLVYVTFIKSPDQIIVSPEALADQWSETVAQFGISPVFPPREDVHVGDVYAVLADDDAATSSSQGKGEMEIGSQWGERVRLKFPRAVKLGHVDAADAQLVAEYQKVVVLPELIDDVSSPTNRIKQATCVGECFSLGPPKQLPLVIFPGTSSARARQSAAQGNWFDHLGSILGAGSRNDAGSVAITIPYAETFGLPAIIATDMLNRFCEEKNGLCDNDYELRKIVAGAAGDMAFKPVAGHGLPDPLNRKNFALRVSLVMVRALFVTRSINYSFAADSSIAAEFRVYKAIEQRLQKEEGVSSPTPPAQPDAPAGPGIRRDPATSAETLAMQRAAMEAERRRLLRLIGETARQSGGNVSFEATTSNRVIIDRVLPRPVVVGFIPVVRDLKSKAERNVAEPE